MHFLVRLKQPLVHRESAQIISRRHYSEETLLARQQGLGLVECAFAIEVFQGSPIRLVIARIAELEQRFDAAVDPAAVGFDMNDEKSRNDANRSGFFATYAELLRFRFCLARFGEALFDAPVIEN